MLEQSFGRFLRLISAFGLFDNNMRFYYNEKKLWVVRR